MATRNLTESLAIFGEDKVHSWYGAGLWVHAKIGMLLLYFRNVAEDRILEARERLGIGEK